MRRKIAFVFLFALVSLFGCQKEVLTDGSDPSLSGSVTGYDYSTNGWDMHIDVDGQGRASITSAVSSRPAAPGDQFIVLGPGAELVNTAGPVFQAPSTNGSPTNYEQLVFPNGGGIYWAIPFDGAKQPVKLDASLKAGPIIGISNCLCTGTTSPACYATPGGGCQTFVCNWCGRIIIVVIRSSNTVVFQGDAEPVALIKADRIVRNGVAFQ